MQPFHIPATRSTPEVVIDAQGRQLRIKGMSIPENAAEFYAPVLRALETALCTQPTEFEARIDLTYFNSSSLKAIYMVLSRLKEARVMGTRLSMVWVVEEEDEFMLESSMYFRDLLGIDMHIEHVDLRDERERRAS